MEIKRVSETCSVTAVANKKTTEATVYKFDEGKSMIVILNKSVKLNMKYNGKVYEGQMAGMDFVSSGPTITVTQQGRVR
jgi:hypothetical protein